MSFIKTTDYNASIRAEILDAITREDPTMVAMIEERAIEEISSYINTRYDVENVFNKVDSNRNPVIVMLCVDIVLYHLHAVYNPAKFPELRQNRYKQAISYLKAVNDGKVIMNLPLLLNSEGSTGDAKEYYFSSNLKRVTQY